MTVHSCFERAARAAGTRQVRPGMGNLDSAENGSWGPVLDGRLHEWGSYNLSTPMKKNFSFVKDNLRNFYTTGFEMNNNVSVRTGNEKMGLMLSYGNTSSNGVLPDNADKYERNTFSFRGNMNFGKFSADASITYIRKDMTKAAAGQGKAGATMQQELIQHPVDIDYSVMKDYNDERYDADNYYTWYAQNPYWVLANNKNSYQDDRIYGKLELSYEVIPGLKAGGTSWRRLHQLTPETAYCETDLRRQLVQYRRR